MNYAATAKYYLTNRLTDGATFTLSSADTVAADTLDPKLSADGWRYATSHNTGFRVFVKAIGNRRWLRGWEKFVTDFEVREVETAVNSEGAIVSELGGKHPRIRRLFADDRIL